VSTPLRLRLVEELERRRAVRTAAVRQAFLRVPRECFVPEYAAGAGLDAVYANEIIVTKSDERGFPLSSSSEPQVMAAMLERLQLADGMRVLEVGAGTGYNAALLRAVVGERGHVVSMDIDADTAALARNHLETAGFTVEVVCGDGYAGHAKGAPFDRIVATGSTGTISMAWRDQLVEGGLLEVPLQVAEIGPLAIATFRRIGSRLESVAVVPGQFMPLRGPAAPRPSALSLPVPQILRDGGKPVVTHLGGPALERLSAVGWRRLFALGEPRTVELGIRFPAWSLGLYLAFELPRRQLVHRWADLATGVLPATGGSLALVEGRWRTGNRPSPVRVHAYGTAGAEEALLAVLDRWQVLGRPGTGDLRLDVSYHGGAARIVHSWATP
jgi:protein-L-isoaspartate(D-aspartate) O-methyltransferase